MRWAVRLIGRSESVSPADPGGRPGGSCAGLGRGQPSDPMSVVPGGRNTVAALSSCKKLAPVAVRALADGRRVGHGGVRPAVRLARPHGRDVCPDAGRGPGLVAFARAGRKGPTVGLVAGDGGLRRRMVAGRRQGSLGREPPARTAFAARPRRWPRRGPVGGPWDLFTNPRSHAPHGANVAAKAGCGGRGCPGPSPPKRRFLRDRPCAVKRRLGKGRPKGQPTRDRATWGNVAAWAGAFRALPRGDPRHATHAGD
jgi:hypothetical protein